MPLYSLQMHNQLMRTVCDVRNSSAYRGSSRTRRHSQPSRCARWLTMCGTLRKQRITEHIEDKLTQSVTAHDSRTRWPSEAPEVRAVPAPLHYPQQQQE